MRPGHYDREGLRTDVCLACERRASMRPGHYDREGEPDVLRVPLGDALQ